jgi:hypothetical protein
MLAPLTFRAQSLGSIRGEKRRNIHLMLREQFGNRIGVTIAVKGLVVKEF